MREVFRRYPAYKWLLALADFVVLNVAFAIALRLRFMPNIDVIDIDDFTVADEVVIFAFYSLLWILIFQWLDLYKRHIIFTKAKQAVALLRGEIYALVGIVLIQFFLKPFDRTLDSRLMFLYFMALSFLGLLLHRLIIARWLLKTKAVRVILTERAVIVGVSPEAKLLAARLLEESTFDVELLGFISLEDDVGTVIFRGHEVVGKVKHIGDVVEKLKINAVYIAEGKMSVSELLAIIEQLESHGVRLHANLEVLSILPKKLSVDYIGEYAIIAMNSSHKLKLLLALKRVGDIVGSLMGLILLSPLMLYIAISVKRSSSGPVFFRQIRIGQGGKPFEFYKFRSMTIGNEHQDENRKKQIIEKIRHENGEEVAPLNKLVAEERITDVGRIIRKYSLDELPQLINVLRGDMSLVGPRPCLPYEWEAYQDWHRRRLDIKPGCTGLWQVMGRGETSFDDMVILDLYYLQNVSPWLDLQILLKTIPVILTGQGGG